MNMGHWWVITKAEVVGALVCFPGANLTTPNCHTNWFGVEPVLYG
jgi:hypothetical protein